MTLHAGELSGGAIAAIVFVWLLPAMFKVRNPWELVIGADGRPSTSKLQFLIWTSVVVFAYVAIYLARCKAGHCEAIDAIPANVLLVMGFSSTTLAGAKAITSAYVASGRIIKTADGGGGIFTDDDGQSDLAKAQLVGWTTIGVIVYVVTVVHCDPLKGLPNIDGALMVLMGLGQGAYLGKKLVTTDSPQILSATAIVRPGRDVVVNGAGFGAFAGTVMVDNFVLGGTPIEWSDTRISFKLPARHPNGSNWSDGQAALVTLNANGQTVSLPKPLVVGLVPRLSSIVPARAQPGQVIRLTGTLLAGASTRVTVDGVDAALVGNVSDDEVALSVPTITARLGVPVVVNVDGNAAPAPLRLDIV